LILLLSPCLSSLFRLQNVSDLLWVIGQHGCPALISDPRFSGSGSGGLGSRVVQSAAHRRAVLASDLPQG
jgi:hypothetical protein